MYVQDVLTSTTTTKLPQRKDLDHSGGNPNVIMLEYQSIWYCTNLIYTVEAYYGT